MASNWGKEVNGSEGFILSVDSAGTRFAVELSSGDVHELRAGSLELLEEKREGGGPRKKKQRRAAAMQDSGAMWRKTRRDNFDGWREAQLVALARTARPLGRDLCVRTLKALTRCSGNFYQARFERLQLDQREGSLRPHGSRVGPSDTRGPGQHLPSPY